MTLNRVTSRLIISPNPRLGAGIFHPLAVPDFLANLDRDRIDRAGERAPFVRTRVENIEKLKHHQGRKRHGLRVAHSAGALHQSSRQRAIENPEGAECHNDADEKNARPHLAGNHAFRARPRRLVHHARVGRVNAQRCGTRPSKSCRPYRP